MKKKEKKLKVKPTTNAAVIEVAEPRKEVDMSNEKMYCPNCSKKISYNDDVCPYCGKKIGYCDKANAIAEKEKKTEKTQTGMIVGLIVNMFGMVGLKFIKNPLADKKSYMRGVFFGSLLQILVILLLVKKFKP